MKNHLKCYTMIMVSLIFIGTSNIQASSCMAIGVLESKNLNSIPANSTVLTNLNVFTGCSRDGLLGGGSLGGPISLNNCTGDQLKNPENVMRFNKVSVRERNLTEEQRQGDLTEDEMYEDIITLRSQRDHKRFNFRITKSNFWGPAITSKDIDCHIVNPNDPIVPTLTIRCTNYSGTNVDFYTSSDNKGRIEIKACKS